MRFWDWFRSTPPPAPQRDLVWLSKSAKLSELASEALAATGPVLVLSHFPETLGEVRKALIRAGAPGEDAVGPLTVAGLLRRSGSGEEPTPLLALVSQLHAEDSPSEP